MNIPGFTAERSLYKTTRTYRAQGVYGSSSDSAVVPSRANVIVVCHPWGDCEYYIFPVVKVETMEECWKTCRSVYEGKELMLCLERCGGI